VLDTIPRMRTRLAATAALALLATGCAGTLEALAPRYFYGNVVGAESEELCLADARSEEPDATRCFVLGEVQVPSEIGDGDLVVVRYEIGEGEEDTAVGVRLVEDR
jgi:hypothetical protein